MKKFILGLLVGISITAAGSVYADEGLQKIEAYLRPTLPITLDGNSVTLESPPVMYDGSTYLKLRDVAKLTGLSVIWNDNTQTVELGMSKGGKPMSDNSTSLETDNTEAIKMQQIKPIGTSKATVILDKEYIKTNGDYYFVEADGNKYVSGVALRDPYEVFWNSPIANFKLEDTEVSITLSNEYYPNVDAFLINGMTVFKLSLLGLTGHIEGDTLIITKQ